MKNLHIDAHLESSNLILYKGLDRTVKLYKFVGDVESQEFEVAKDYFYHVTPDFALKERLIGFYDYDDIGYYCQEQDIWIVEELMQTPLELTIGFEKQTLIDEKDRRERAYLKYMREQKENIAKIDEAFSDAVYPQRRHDHLLDVLYSSRIYVPEGRRFFSEYGVMYIVREQGDFIARLTNCKYDNDLCNTTGFIRGIYCYIPYVSAVARLINENCVDETDGFRQMYNSHSHYKGYPQPKDYPHHHPHVDCKFKKHGKGGLY